MNPRRVRNVLFLCTGNSARSIMAEALLNHLGRGRFRAFSAGSRALGRLNPLAVDTLLGLGVPVDGLASKGWEAFAGAGAPSMDAVVTVCDRAAAETCPVWPGHPASAHWGFADPAACEGSEAERRAAFARTLARIEACVRAFLAAAHASDLAADLGPALGAAGQQARRLSAGP
jgi:arsenate reductase